MTTTIDTDPQMTNPFSEEERDKVIAADARRKLADVSTIYPASITAQAAEIARRCQEAQSENGYASPAKLGEKFIASEDEIAVVVDKAIFRHRNAAIQALKRDGKESDEDAIEQYMLARRFPTSEQVELQIRPNIKDTFGLAERMMILSPKQIEGILSDYQRYHHRLTREEGEPEERYRADIDDRLAKAEARLQEREPSGTLREQAATLVRRAFSRNHANAGVKATQSRRRIFERKERGGHAAKNGEPTQPDEIAEQH